MLERCDASDLEGPFKNDVRVAENQKLHGSMKNLANTFVDCAGKKCVNRRENKLAETNIWGHLYLLLRHDLLNF